jgi:methionyl-tRNA formyltransferase
MKAVLVTSDVTYCPDNYQVVLKSVLNEARMHIAGLIVIKIPRSVIVKSLTLLSLAGCKEMRQTLVSNVYRSKQLFNDWQEKYNLPIKYTRDVNDNAIVSWLQSVECDLIINMRARVLFKNQILSLPKYSCLNIHHGLLPRQRGLYSDLYAIANQEDTGYSVHTMTGDFDKGQILYREIIQKDNNYMNYLHNAMTAEWKTIVECLNYIEENRKLPSALKIDEESGKLTATPTFSRIKELQKTGMVL